MQEFSNSVLGRSGADGRRLRSVYSEFLKRNGGIEWSSVGGDDTVLKIMPAATDGAVYIYRRDVRIMWDSKNYKILPFSRSISQPKNKSTSHIDFSF